MAAPIRIAPSEVSDPVTSAVSLWLPSCPISNALLRNVQAWNVELQPRFGILRPDLDRLRRYAGAFAASTCNCAIVSGTITSSPTTITIVSATNTIVIASALGTRRRTSARHTGCTPNAIKAAIKKDRNRARDVLDEHVERDQDRDSGEDQQHAAPSAGAYSVLHSKPPFGAVAGPFVQRPRSGVLFGHHQRHVRGSALAGLIFGSFQQR